MIKRQSVRRAAIGWAALVIAVGLDLGRAAAKDDELSRAQTALFETPYLSELAVPSTLTYGFRRTASDGSGFDDRIILKVVEDQGQGRRKAAFEFLSGKAQMPFQPKEGVQGNPLIMMFLQRDVLLMARNFGGDYHYFRVRILGALRRAARARSVAVDFQGSETEMTRVTIEPFLNDPERARFADEAGKRYEFTVSSSVPGGIYRLRSLVPNGSGGAPLVEETVTFQAITR